MGSKVVRCEVQDVSHRTGQRVEHVGGGHGKAQRYVSREEEEEEHEVKPI